MTDFSLKSLREGPDQAMNEVSPSLPLFLKLFAASSGGWAPALSDPIEKASMSLTDYRGNCFSDR